ncbi:HSP18 transcriptional regulator [Streptomyces sp. NPDC008125]|uniref:HSP18 transcriptional regulator n=1 Tax=Streptomyces sp. NPDC008125 TaxID=3364811 RepID=UPI0036EE3A7C
MNETSEPAPHPSPEQPVTFLAAATALHAIDQVVRDARRPSTAPSSPGAPPSALGHAPGAGPEAEPAADIGSGPHPALAALLMLREIREQLAGWEAGLIETARDRGASWADLAGPLGVASRQAAERRYLRNRPGTAGSTGEQRVQATRDDRAADRSVTSWARDNAADLRRLAGRVTALTGLPEGATAAVGDLNLALAENDAARLVRPLTDTGPHLRERDADLADSVDAMTRHADQLRRNSREDRAT